LRPAEVQSVAEIRSMREAFSRLEHGLMGGAKSRCVRMA